MGKVQIVSPVKQQPNPKPIATLPNIHPPLKKKYSTLQFNKFLQIFTFLIPASDSQEKESQMISPVLLLLRQIIVFRKGLWRGMSDSPLRSPLTASQLDR